MKKTRVDKSWSKHNLPEELWAEILSRLPVKSLLRFRCVSKSWQSLIDDPDFSCIHLNRFKNNRDQTHLFVVQGDYSGADCLVRCSNTFKITERLAFLEFFGSCNRYSNNVGTLRSFGYPGKWDVVSTIDGLVMLAKDTTIMSSPTPELMLWNPSIRKFRSLPPSPEISNGMISVRLGLGFDPFSKDYKYVRLIEFGGSNLHSIAVYSLGADSWKTIQFRGKGCVSWRWSFGFICQQTVICSGGCLYFIEVNLDSEIKELVSFDLSSEEFSCTCLPVNHDLGYPHYSLDEKLAVVDGRCSLVDFERLTQGSIWVLESSGADGESLYWNKRYSFTTQITGFLYLNKNGDVFLIQGRRVGKYNVETRKEKLLQKCFRYPARVEVYDYVESLMLLK